MNYHSIPETGNTSFSFDKRPFRFKWPTGPRTVWVPSPGVKRRKLEADHVHPFSVQFKNWNICASPLSIKLQVAQG